ncbi:hypothetical protein QEN19_004289 [Hanseniaspora menglaensis]
MNYQDVNEIPFGINLAPITHNGTTSNAINPNQNLASSNHQLQTNNGNSAEEPLNDANSDGTHHNNSENAPRLHHYIYAPSRKLLPEHLDLHHQMSLKLSRIKGDDTTSLAVPVKKVDAINERRDKKGFFSLRLTAINDPNSRRGVYFDPLIRSVGPCSEILIGRFTERLNGTIVNLDESVRPCLFKSKVVSRTHACFRVDCYGNWYLKDLKSSSGTFLNHIRIAPASIESNDFLLKDGDTIQLGMDFRGGTEELYRCIKFRVEINKSWKLKASKYNKQLMDKMKTGFLNEQDDCSICLTKVKPCQPLFISPCAHIWHYSCIRRMIITTYPTFDCPNCRKRTDLEAALDSDSDEEDEEEAVDAEGNDDELENSIEDSEVEEITEDDCLSDDLNKGLNTATISGTSNVILNPSIPQIRVPFELGDVVDDDVEMQSLG